MKFLHQKLKIKLKFKKNSKENGDWFIESNPHSKGLIFSQFLNSFLEIKKFNINIKNKIKKIIKNIKIKLNIIYIKCIELINWKLIILIILCEYLDIK